MRLGLLTYGLDRPLSGIARYTVELVRALARVEPAPEMFLLTAGEPAVLGSANGYTRLPLRGCRLLPALITLGNVLIPYASRRARLQVIHDPTGVTPFLFGAGEARIVVTIHDVFVYSCPGTNTLLDTLIYRYWLPRLLPRVDAVITVSQTSKGDIIRYLRVSTAKIHVIAEGVGTAYRHLPAEEVSKIKTRYSLPERFILFVGSLEKRKNLLRLLEAYNRLSAWSGRWHLVIVGARNFWKSTPVTQTVEKLNLRSCVQFTGYIAEDDLPALYNAADLFVFPSLYEGFGLPPLEAMACGTPVVCSNAASLPEVVGDAAIMVDPYDVEGLAEAMLRVLTDASLREELRERGLERAKQFTWEHTARETLKVYQEVLNS